MFIEAKIKDFQNAKGSVVIFDRGQKTSNFIHFLPNGYRERVGYRN